MALIQTNNTTKPVGTNIQNGILGGLASAGNWIKGAVNTVGQDLKNGNALNPAALAQQAINKGQTNLSKVSANTPTPSPAPLGVKAIAPTSKSTPTTLSKNQTAPLIKNGTINNSTQNASASTPAATNTSTLPANTQIDTNTQAQNEAQFNNRTSPFVTAIGGLAGANAANKAITDSTQNQVNGIAQNIAQLRQGANTQEQAYNTGMIQPRAQGLAQNVAQTEAGQESALQSELTNELAASGQALTGQAQTQSAEQAAGQLAAPNSNIINVDPTTGLPIAGGSLGQLAQTAGQVQGIQSGAAAQAAAGGNIAAQNATALGTASTSANASSINNFQSKINNTQNASATINNLANGIVPNMTATGFNPTSSPIGNQTFAQYFTEKNPAAKQGITQGLAEIKNQVSNIIASATGLTPTGVTAALGDIDFTNLNPQQLHDFLGYIDSYAQSNIQAAQQSIKTLQNGGSVGANPTPLPVPAANSSGQAAAGTGATLAEGLIGKIVSEAGNAVAGAVGGIASSILK